MFAILRICTFNSSLTAERATTQTQNIKHMFLLSASQSNVISYMTSESFDLGKYCNHQPQSTTSSRSPFIQHHRLALPAALGSSNALMLTMTGRCPLFQSLSSSSTSCVSMATWMKREKRAAHNSNSRLVLIRPVNLNPCRNITL